MVKKSEIIEVIQNRVEKISALCEDISKNFDGETIHKFRVSVKKLRSFLRLLKIANEGKSPGLTKKFKELYHIAGYIRDNTLAIEKMTAEKLAVPGYLELRHSNIEEYKKQWQEQYSKKILHRLENKLTSYDFQPLHPGALKDFMHKSFRNIEVISSTALPGNADIHRLRKIMKDMLYLSAFTDKEWEKAREIFDDVPDKDLEALTNIIGQFNDERLTLEQLTDFAEQCQSKKEKNKIENFCNDEATLLTEKKKDIMAATKDFLHSAKKV